MAAIDGARQSGDAGAMLREAAALAAFFAVWVVLMVLTPLLAPLDAYLPLMIQATVIWILTTWTMIALQRMSGGVQNPLLGMAQAMAGYRSWRRAVGYSIAHVAGAVAAGYLLTGAMREWTRIDLIGHVWPPVMLTDVRLIGDWLAAIFLINAAVATRNDAAPAAALVIGGVVAVTYFLSGGAIIVNPAIVMGQGLFQLGLDIAQAQAVMITQFAGAFTGYWLAKWAWNWEN